MTPGQAAQLGSTPPSDIGLVFKGFYLHGFKTEKSSENADKRPASAHSDSHMRLLHGNIYNACLTVLTATEDHPAVIESVTESNP